MESIDGLGLLILILVDIFSHNFIIKNQHD